MGPVPRRLALFVLLAAARLLRVHTAPGKSFGGSLPLRLLQLTNKSEFSPALLGPAESHQRLAEPIVRFNAVWQRGQRLAEMTYRFFGLPEFAEAPCNPEMCFGKSRVSGPGLLETFECTGAILVLERQQAQVIVSGG